MGCSKALLPVSPRVLPPAATQPAAAAPLGLLRHQQPCHETLRHVPKPPYPTRISQADGLQHWAVAKEKFCFSGTLAIGRMDFC